ncbi:MAG: hypothetical protein OHK0046_12940 [Anaerolineae bacterium]
MNPPYHLEVVTQLQEADIETLSAGLIAYNAAHAGDENYQQIAVLLRDAENTTIGGILG